MLGVTLLAIPLAYVGGQAKIVRQRRAILDHIVGDDRGAYGTWPYNRPNPPKGQNGEVASVPWVRRLLGDVAVTSVGLPPNTDVGERRRIHAVFPDAELTGAVFRTTSGGYTEILVPFDDEKELGETKY